MPFDELGGDVRLNRSESRGVYAHHLNSTAICCTVRTVLTGALLDKDLSCEYSSSFLWKPDL